MTDRLSLTNALTAGNIEREAAERIATEIFDAIHDNVVTKQDLQRAVAELEQRMLLRFAELERRLTLRFVSVLVIVTAIILATVMNH